MFLPPHAHMASERKNQLYIDSHMESGFHPRKSTHVSVLVKAANAWMRTYLGYTRNLVLASTTRVFALVSSGDRMGWVRGTTPCIDVQKIGVQKVVAAIRKGDCN